MKCSCLNLFQKNPCQLHKPPLRRLIDLASSQAKRLLEFITTILFFVVWGLVQVGLYFVELSQ